MSIKMNFSAADEKYNLTRFGSFDSKPEMAFIHEGDLCLGSNVSGIDVVKVFGVDSPPKGRNLFVVTGDLIVDGLLDLDRAVYSSFGLVVLGRLKAKVVCLDMTMLFVFGGAEVSSAIIFESNDGTLSIAGTTVCPLVVIHDGDANLSVKGEVFNSYDEGPLAEEEDQGEESNENDSGYPLPKTTMTCAEAAEKLNAELFDEDGNFDSETATAWAIEGKPLFR